MAKIEIPDELHDKIKKVINDIDEVNSVAEYVALVLEESMEDFNESGNSEEAIKERLKGLGYL